MVLGMLYILFAISTLQLRARAHSLFNVARGVPDCFPLRIICRWGHISTQELCGDAVSRARIVTLQI